MLASIILENGQSYQFRYNAYGEITKIIYPTGGFERFKYAPVSVVQPAGASYDQANRGVIDRWISAKGDGTDEAHWTYSTGLGVTYAPDGTRTEQNIITETDQTPQPYGFGNALTGRPYDERSYSSTGQILTRKLTDFATTGPQSGGYSAATNNGSQTWTQVFGFDRYGNRNIISGTGVTSFSFSGNRITAHTFDTAGNTTNDGTRTFTYDAENKQTQVNNGSTGQYFYDGDGRRVKKVIPGGETTIFVYDAASKLIAEYSTNVEPAATAKIAYLTADHLGSPRINTDQTGAVTSRHDYRPFGEEIATAQRAPTVGYAADTIRKQFTGYERDGESGLDFAQARYFGSSLGRFTSVDPTLKSMDFSNPQSFNRYAYALNNPLAFIDPDGLEALKVGRYEDLTDEQKRLFQTYVAANYGKQIGDGDVSKFAGNLFNQSADLANGVTKGDGKGLLNQSQLTTFLGVTSLLEARGVIGEVTSVTTINGDQKADNFRILGELKGADSAKKIFEALPSTLGGTDKKPYVVSRREGGLFQQPNGQVTLTENLIGINVDVDYRKLARIFSHNTKDNSDIRADDGNTSHFRRHVETYGPIKALTPVNPTFVRKKR